MDRPISYSEHNRIKTFRLIAEKHQKCVVGIMDSKTHKSIAVGSITEIATRCGLSRSQVIGFAEWGKPTKKLKNYYLTYTIHYHTEKTDEQ